MLVAARTAALSLLFLGLLPPLIHAEERQAVDLSLIVHDVRVRIEPGSGEITVLDRISSDGSPIIFDPADWLNLTEMQHNDSPFAVVGDPPHTVPTASGMITIRAQGIIPAQADGPANAGNGPDGTFLFNHADWLATSPAATSRYRLTIEVPVDHRAVSTGQFISERIGETHYEAEFLFESPEEGPSIFVGPYVVQERLQDDLRLRTYFHPEGAAFADAYLDATEGFIRRYASLIGAYPYDGFSVVSAPIPVGLGFNSLTYVSKDILPRDYMRGRSLAHEVLHSWWGNAVRVDYETGNWAEGLTSYQADYAIAEERDDSSATEMRLEWLRSLSSLSPEMDVPVRDFRTASHEGNQAIGYNKTAMVFHMLRREAGEQEFQDGIRIFWEKNRFAKAGWTDIQAAFEQSTGSDLARFFDQWLNRRGLPEIAIADLYVREAEQGNEIMLSLVQTTPAYALRLPVRIETDYGTETVDVEMTDASETFVIKVPHLPRALAVDPDFDVARKLVAGEQVPILSDVLYSPDPVIAIPSEDPLVRQIARDLSVRLLRREVNVVAVDTISTEAGAVVVIGLTEEVALLSEQGLPDPVAQSRAGTARGWTAAEQDAAPRLFLSADTTGGLATAFGALRYYGNRSFVVFDDDDIEDAGVWNGDASALNVVLD